MAKSSGMFERNQIVRGVNGGRYMVVSVENDTVHVRKVNCDGEVTARKLVFKACELRASKSVSYTMTSAECEAFTKGN